MYTTREKRIQCILKKEVIQEQIIKLSLKNGVKVFQKKNGLHIMEMETGKSEKVRILDKIAFI